MISDQQARDNIVTDLSTSLAVDAGAGTGKTTLLIDRLIAILLREEIPLPRIAAITFTDKAAGELIERLRDKLEKKFEQLSGPEAQAQEKLIRKALKDLEQASVSTIHSFCSSILREYPVEAGVDPQFVVLDQVQTDALENQTWETWLKKVLADRVECLMAFFKLGAHFGHVEDLKGHLLKNRSLLIRSQVTPIPDGQETAAFIEKSWNQIQSLRSSGQDGDGLVEALKGFEKDLQACASLQGEALALKLAILDVPATKGSKSGNQKNWDKEALVKIRESLVHIKETQESFASGVKDSVLRSVSNWLWDYLETYSRTKAGQGFLDFDDLLSKTRDLLKNHGEVREELKKRFDRLFVDEFQDTDPLQVEIVFFLSEKKIPTAKAVGTAKARHSSGGLLAGESAARLWQDVKLEPGKLFLVGDPQQSIYRFRRADVEIYSEAKAKLLASGGKVEKLTENFRTLSPIVEWVNKGFEKLFATGPFPYNIQNASRLFEKNPQILQALIGLEIPELPEEEQKADAFRKIEAKTVASFIDQIVKEKMEIVDPKSSKDNPLRRPVQAGDIAILFRELSNTEAVYEDALRGQGLQFQIVGGKKFYNRPEIVVLETLLSCLESPADEAGLAALLRSSLFGFTDEELFLYRESGGSFQFLRKVPGKMGEAFEKLREWHFKTRDQAPAEALLYLYDQTNLLAVAASQPHGEQRVANLMKVVDQCRDLESSQNFTYRAFVKWLSRQREEDAMEGEAPGPEETGNQVTLMTLHKAKGLEFPVVILSGAAKEKPKPSNFIVNRVLSEAQFKTGEAGLELWTSAYEKSRDEELAQETAETLRLLYVGCTRARESLVLPLFSQEKGGDFLKSITTQFDLDALSRTSVTLTRGEGVSLALAVDLKEKDKKSVLVLARMEALQKLQDDKKALVEKRRGKSRLSSVTSLVHTEDDKPEREGYSLEGERIPITEDGQAQGKAFGVLTHQLLEKGWDWEDQTLRRAALLWAPLAGLSSEKGQEAVDLAVGALASDLLKRAKGSSRVFRELSLTGKNPEGAFLNAVIDLAFLEDNAWVVVDYKTDLDPQRGLESYRKQLGYYSGLLETFTKLKVKESYLYFLRYSQVIKVQ